MRPLDFPKAPPLGDVNFWIQRGASLQTSRMLNGQPVPNALLTAAQAIDTLHAIAFPIGLGARLDRLSFNVSALAAGSSARVGIYRSTSRRNIYPSSLVVDSGAIATTSNGYKTAAVNVPLKPGLYWSVYFAGVLAPTVSVIPNTATNIANAIAGWDDTPVARNCLRVALAFGALPAAFPGGAAWVGGPMTAVWGRFSA